MNDIEKFIDNSGMITTKTIVKNNESKTGFYKYLKNNDFEMISRGIYATKNAWIDPLLVAHMKCPNSVLSHDVALHYYGLIDREPECPTLTIYSGYNASRLKKFGYRVFFVQRDLLDVGKTEVVDFDGNRVPMYNLERTICDLVRNRSSFEIQDFNSALKAYSRRQDKNLTLLFKYAKLFRVEKLLRTYMEVLL